MLTKANKVLQEQLTRNLAEQDFYKNVCTEISIGNNVVLELRHPSLIKDLRTGEDVFPEFAQNDIDKEFEPMIAVYFSFSMKNDKVQLERFKAWTDFAEFKEVKDFGARTYAMDFGTDVGKAASKCIDLLKDIYEADTARSIKILTHDIDNEEEYCKKTITPPEKEPEPIKVDGVATRVIEEQQAAYAPMTDISDTTYKRVQWAIGAIIAFFLVMVVMFMRGNDRYEEAEPEEEVAEVADYDTSEPSDAPISAEKRDRFLGEIEQAAVKEGKAEESKTEIIGKWREIDSGGSYVWQLEKNTASSQYKLIQIMQGQLFQELNCIRKKVKRNGEYMLHDVRSERTVALNKGAEIYHISNFDNGADAILIIKNDAAYLYSNDIDRQVYDYFAILTPIH